MVLISGCFLTKCYSMNVLLGNTGKDNSMATTEEELNIMK